MNELHDLKVINFSILRKAFNFYLHADSKSRQNSLFVKDLFTEVIDNNRHYYALDKLDTLRSHLKRNKSKIQHADFGAGSQFKTNEKTVASFVSSSASDAYKGEVLFHLSRIFKPIKILELGTNVGMGAAYLASANQNSTVITLEGCPNLSEVARTIFSSIHIKNIEVITGQFSNTLTRACIRLEAIDLAFIDGDHSYQATIDNYNTIKPFLHDKSLVVLDDIYWSDGMLKAWKEIKSSAEVSMSVDLFRMGILFFDPTTDKNELKLVSSRYKPWQR